MAATEITLANLDGGALMELASREFRKICDNIADPNVNTSAKRKMQISIIIAPDRKGQSAELTYAVKSQLVGPDAAKTMAYIAMAPGSQDINLFGVDTRQDELFPEKQSEQYGPVAVMPIAVNG